MYLKSETVNLVVMFLCLPEGTINFCGRYDSDEPVSLTNNVQKMLRLLREADWPVSEKDVYLLLDEIAKGEKYINQSKILRKAADIENTYNDIKKESSASNSSLESSHRSRSIGSVSSQNSSKRSGVSN